MAVNHLQEKDLFYYQEDTLHQATQCTRHFLQAIVGPHHQLQIPGINSVGKERREHVVS